MRTKTELIRRIQKAEGNYDCFGTAKGYRDQFQCSFRQDFLRPSSAGRDKFYDERRVRYGKTDSVGGLFNNDEGKGQEGKEAYLDGLL